jgi:hypothetical protein
MSCTRTLYAGKFNIIIMGVFVGLQKSDFLVGKTLYLGTSYAGNSVFR